MTGPLQLFRGGRWYESLDTAEISWGLRTCMTPEILLRNDARRVPTDLPRLSPDSRRKLLDRAMMLFRYDTLEIGGLGEQTPAGFAAALGAAVGLPEPLVWRWCDLLATEIETLPDVEPAAEDWLVWLPGNTFTCLVAVAEAVLRGSSVLVRPSTREPLSAARFVAALVAAGWPADRIRFCPTSTDALDTLIRLTDRQIVYGGDAVVEIAGVEVRGPGRACAIVAPDADPDRTAEWLVKLIAHDSGRFCTNVCTVACLGDPEPLATRLGALLDEIDLTRRPVGWVHDRTATSTADFIQRRMTDVDERITKRGIVVRAGGHTFLAPTLVLLADAAHPLAACELPFPFAAVVAVDAPAADRLASRSRFVHKEEAPQ